MRGADSSVQSSRVYTMHVTAHNQAVDRCANTCEHVEQFEPSPHLSRTHLHTAANVTRLAGDLLAAVIQHAPLGGRYERKYGTIT